MGNAASLQSCYKRRGKVKVIMLSGEVKEFNGFVTASTVMKKYPKHLILHCSVAGNQEVGQRRKLAVLRPEHVLKSNQNYLLIPIQAAGTARSFLDSWAFFSLNMSQSKGNEQSDGKEQKKKLLWWIPKKIYDKIFKPQPIAQSTSEEEANPFLTLGQPSYRSRKSVDDEWRPSLDCIPESLRESLPSSPLLSHNNSCTSAQIDRLTEEPKLS